MTAVRAVLIATIILGLAATPLVAPVFGGATTDEQTAYAAFAGGTRADEPVFAPAQQNGNNNNGNNNNNNDNGDNNNNNDNGDDNNNNNNDNGDDNDNNNNDNGDDDNGNGNGNDNVVVVVRNRTPNESVNRPTKCFDTREVGVVQLGTGSYDVTVTVMPHSSFNQTTRLTLRSVPLTPVSGQPSSPSAVTKGTLIDSVVFQLVAQSSCDGAEIGMLPNLVNMGIVYNVTQPVDKSKLQIVRWTGTAWEDIQTVPDPVPGNPYVSATISQAGIYALTQLP
jgi:hypothetical protein